MLSAEDKMYQIAKCFGDLNSKGKVKRFRANEKGYARVRDIISGCTLFVIHTNDGELKISLLITLTALSKYEATCQRAVKTFKSFPNNDVKKEKWIHALENNERDQYSVYVTNRDLPEIFKLVDELKEKLLSV